MKTILLISLLSLFSFKSFAQSGPEINVDGIIFPKLATPPLDLISTKGQIIYNTTSSKFQTFNGSSWVDLIEEQGGLPSTLVDDDGDSKIEFGEGFTPIDPDEIIFRTDGSNTLILEKTNGGNTRLRFSTSSINIGGDAGLRATSAAANNIAIGTAALRLNEAASGNVAIGNNALKNMNTNQSQTNFGRNNVAIGHEAMEDADGFSGDNSIIGYQAGLVGASQSVMVGSEAGKSGGSGSVFLGYKAGTDAADVSQTLFINNKSGDEALIYGKFDEGKIVINADGSSVDDALLVNATSSKHGPMRIKIDDATKFRVHSNGGVSVGTFQAPFDNGLKVAYLDESGPPTPLYADDRGNITRRSGMKYIAIPAHDIREDRWSGNIAGMHQHAYRIPAIPPNPAISLHLTDGHYAPVELPHGSTIKEITIRYVDPPIVNLQGNIYFALVRTHVTDGSDKTVIQEFESFTDSADIQTRTFAIDHVVDYENYYYNIIFNYVAVNILPVEAGVIYATTIGYEY